MVKLLRAHGGCLAQDGDEGRGKLRKAGEPPTGNDPEISEWGNPALIIERHPALNT